MDTGYSDAVRMLTDYKEMMNVRKSRLPVGIDSFSKIRRNGYYYVDKTDMIAELLSNLGEVNFFTRPRRFGKTLNMDMLRCFFEK